MSNETDPSRFWVSEDGYHPDTDDQTAVIADALYAVAAEMRTANLIAYWTASGDGTFSQMSSTNPASDIRERLGIK